MPQHVTADGSRKATLRAGPPARKIGAHPGSHIGAMAHAMRLPQGAVRHDGNGPSVGASAALKRPTLPSPNGIQADPARRLRPGADTSLNPMLRSDRRAR